MEFNPSSAFKPYIAKAVNQPNKASDNTKGVWTIVQEDLVHQGNTILPKEINSLSSLKIIRNYKSGTYEGNLMGLMRHGFGTFLCNDGSKYEGQFQDDEMTGVGTYYNQNRYFRGDFVEGAFKFGEVYENNRLIFRGAPGENGYGIYYFPDNKTSYHGYLNDQTPNGEGSMTYRFNLNEAYVFTGNFISGMNVGSGKLEYPNRAIYTGEFENVLDAVPMPHGNGMLTYSSGEIFVGSFEDGLPQAGKIVENNNIYYGKFEYTAVKTVDMMPDDHALANSLGIRQGKRLEGAFKIDEQKRAAVEELSEAVKKRKLI